MCKISNEIKFCTCTNKNYYELENAWIIFRRKEGWSKIGQTIFNENDLKIQKVDIKTIEGNLNSKKMFDFDYIPEEDDKLKIKLSYQNKCSEYDYKYVNNKWSIYIESFDILKEFSENKPQYFEEFSGKIDTPFK